MILEEFLVSLGFRVARSELNQFNSALAMGGKGFALLAKAAELTAAVVEYSIGKMADDLDKLYFASIRTKASAENLVAFSYAARQTGSSASAAAQSVEALASKLRRNPGLAQFFENMGIKTADPTQMIEQLQKRISNLPMFIQLQYAEMLGVDDKTYMALGKGGPFKEEQAKVAAAMGLDIGKAATAANSLFTALRSTGMVLDSIGMKIVQELAGPLGSELNNLKGMIIDNSAAIAKAIEYLTVGLVKVIEFVVRMSLTLVHGLQDLWHVFEALSPTTQKWIEDLGALVAVLSTIRLLALTISAPFAIAFAAITAILLLLDDYYAWKKGGNSKSLFDWGGAAPAIDEIQKRLAQAGDFVKEHWQWMIDLFTGKLFTDGNAQEGFRGAVEQMERTLGVSHREDAPGAPPNSNNQLNANRVATISQELMQAGYTREQISGILGNMQQESSFNPAAGKGTAHVGIVQWDATAQANFNTRFGGVGKLEDADVATQTKFLIWELNNTEKTAGDAIRRSSTVGDATNGMLMRERPANQGTPEWQTEYDKRLAAAKFWQGRPQSAGDRLLETPSMPSMPSMVPSDAGILNGQLPGMPYPMPGYQPSSAIIHQHNHYNIQGTDPQGIAGQIAVYHEQSNRTLLRNTRGALT